MIREGITDVMLGFCPACDDGDFASGDVPPVFLFPFNNLKTTLGK